MFQIKQNVHIIVISIAVSTSLWIKNGAIYTDTALYTDVYVLKTVW